MNTKAKFSQLIAVRFTREELGRLQEAASKRGLCTSTFVRTLVNQELKPLSSGPRRMTSDEFREVIASTLARLDKASVNGLLKDVSIGDPDDPMLLVWAGQTQKWRKFTSLFLKALLASLGVEVSLSENEELIEMRERPARKTAGKRNTDIKNKAKQYERI